MRNQAVHTSLDFRRLRQQVGVADVLSAYRLGSALRQRGDQLIGPCPLHGGDNPTAFRVHLGRNLWHCYTGCGGGDVVELVRVIEGCSYAAAAVHLRQLACARGTAALETRARSSRDSPSAAAVEALFRPFRRAIPLEPRAPFLQGTKRITVPTAARLELGLPDPRSSFLRGTVAVRLHDLDGHPLGYCGRRLDEHDVDRLGKWRFPTGFPKSEVLYNAHRARPARSSGVVVVECPWAAARLTQAGCRAAVALLGTNLSPQQARWLAAAPSILLLLDADPAGRSATQRLVETLRPITTVHVHQLSNGLEPEDLPDHDLARLVGAYLPSSLNQCDLRAVNHAGTQT